ncbi:Genetic suppressor element 1 [Rhodotorula toruloides]
MQLLRSALRLPECHFLAASDWEYALPMYVLKLKGMQQPPSPLSCSESTMLPVSRSLQPRTTPTTNSPTVTHPPYLFAVGRLVPISGSVAEVGHSLPHMVIGGSVSDDIRADLLSLINNDPRYYALANDLRLAGYGAAASSSSGASAGGIARGASSALGRSTFSHPATTLPLSTFPIRESSASRSHDVHELSAAPVHNSVGMLAGRETPRTSSGEQAVTDRSDNAAESFYRPLTLQELRKTSELQIGYLFSNGTIGDVFSASTLTASAPAAGAAAYDSSGPSTPTSREQTSQDLTDTPPEPGIPVLPHGVDPIGSGADGVVHQVIGFGETSLVAKVYHADCLEAAATELSIDRKIFDVVPNTKLVPRLFGAYRGSQYLEWETNIVVMEDGGFALRSWTDLTPDERATLYASLHDLHSVGIYHNDIRPGNVLRSSAGQLRFVDLTTAFMHTCEGHDCYELQRFREILEL